jgi:ABC-type glutathione transport system ATPase component
MPADAILRARGLTRRYGALTALDAVDLEVARGATLALVGESGSGKSTLARCLARLEEPDAGELLFEGRDVLALGGRDLRPFHARVQLVLQDAAACLNPRFTAAEIVAEPLVVCRRGSSGEQRRRALELMELTGLPADRADQPPHRFSGGQRQRLALARALALEPELLILDEALSGLDVSIQAHMANLLMEIQRQRSLTYLFISHDLAFASCLAGEMAVMHRGRVVERGAPRAILAAPSHPHTRALVAAIPELPCAT